MCKYKVTNKNMKRLRFGAEGNRSLGSALEGPNRNRPRYGISRSDLKDL